MQAGRGRGDVFQIAEHASGIQHRVDFRVECALTLVLDMMDRKAGNDSVKLAQGGEWMVEVMRHHGNGRIAGKALSGSLKHGRREVDGDRFRIRMLTLHQRQQPSISCTQIENAARGLRNELEQRRFAFRAMRNAVGSLEVVEGVIGSGPEIDGHATV